MNRRLIIGVTENRIGGYALTNAAGRGVSVAFAYGGTYLTNAVYTLPNGNRFTGRLTRESARRNLVTRRDCFFGGQLVFWYSTEYDLGGRPTNATDSVSTVREWLYNRRPELVGATIGTNVYGYAYDTIGNRSWAVANAATNAYTANAINQYTSILCDSTSLREPTYNTNGDLLTFGVWSFTYDVDSRLLTVSSNGVLLVTNDYGCQGRRVRKTTPEAVTTFLYDDWNLIRETVTYETGYVDTLEYFWGRDLSGTLQGAGGVGGLLYVKRNDTIYIPFTDANGNITAYADSTGAIIAEYVYDAFGHIIAQSGSLAHVFRHRFSSKYFDSETGLYYYGYRFYHPALMRWINRDPISESGGLNLYAFCVNKPLESIDPIGQDRYMTTFGLDPRLDRCHVGVAVDSWKCSDGRWVKTGVTTFDFGVDDSSYWNRLGTYFVTVGTISERDGNCLEKPFTIFSTPQQDIEMLRRIRSEMSNPPLYSFFFNNCIQWANRVIDYGMEK